MSRRSWAFDVAIAVVVAALGVLEAVWGIDSTHRQGPVWAQAVLYVVTGGLLVVRRLHPVLCMAAILVVSTVEFALFGSPEGMGVALPSLVAEYTIGRRVEVRRSWVLMKLGVRDRVQAVIFAYESGLAGPAQEG